MNRGYGSTPYGPGDRVRARDIPPAELAPGLIAQFPHDTVTSGDEGTVERYELLDDGDEVILIRFDRIGYATRVSPEYLEHVAASGAQGEPPWYEGSYEDARPGDLT